MQQWERPLDLLEAAYRTDGTDREWTADLVRTMSRTFRREGLGAGGFWARGRVDDQGRTVLDGIRFQHVDHRSPQRRREALDAISAYPSLSPELQQQLYFSPATASTASAVTGLGQEMGADPSWAKSGVSVEAQDALGLACHDDPLNAFVLSAPLREITTPKSAHVRFWKRVASHVGAGFRLRRVTRPGLDRADAVFSPSGKLHHVRAAGDVEAAKDGFARRRYARTHRASAEVALEVWQGLHDGRWSLVDYLDTDGRAFVIAVQNQPAREVASALSDRQRAAVALAALGYGNKQIAYALGLTAAAVAMLLARARAAAKVRTRVELVHAFKRALAGPRT